MPVIRQTSFAGGEIAPQLYGRSDLPLYSAALRKCRNFIVAPDGTLMNRPGTQYVATTKTSAKRSRLIPFLFGGDQNYVLEFGDLYFRVHYRGAYLGVEVVTTYLEADLARLQYTQSGDTLTIVHPSYKPREVKRTGHVLWAIADKSFASLQAAPTAPGNNLLDVATAPLKPNSWDITAVDKDGNESAPVTYAPANSHVTDTTPAELKWTAAAGAVLYNVYRGQSGVRGYVGSATGLIFRDDGQPPDFSQQPPSYPNPFNAAGDYPSTVAYHEQRLVFGGTLNSPAKIWMSTTGIFRLFESHVPPADDDGVIFSLASRKYEEIRGLISLKSLLVNTSGAEWAVSGAGPQQPITATGLLAQPHSYRGSSWLQPVAGGDVALYVQERGTRIRDLAYQFEMDGYSGNDLSIFGHHLVDGHTIVDWAFAQNPWSIVWAVRDDGVLLGLTYVREQNVFAWHQHDTNQQDLLGLFDPTALTGLFESVCVIPEGGEDVPYFIVQRNVGGVVRYVERFTTRQVQDFRLGVFMDCSKTFDGRNTTATTLTVTDTGGGWGVGAFLNVAASAALFAAGDIAMPTMLHLNPDASYTAVFGAGPVQNTTVVRLRLTGFTDAQHVQAQVVNVAVPAGYQGAATAAWGIARAYRTGLDHLQGAYVIACEDGNVGSNDALNSGGSRVGQLVFGRLEMSNDTGIVTHVGLRMASQLELLDLASDAKGNQKLCTRVGADVLANPLTGQVLMGETLPAPTLGFGPSPVSKLPAVRTMPQWQGPFTLGPLQGQTQIPVKSSWGRAGRAVLEHVDPLPLTVLSIWREVEVGGAP